MFYVTGMKIYLDRFDESRGVYPEVKLRRSTSGNIFPEVQATGISQKPKARELCTLREVIARFGAGVFDHTDATSEEKPQMK